MISSDISKGVCGIRRPSRQRGSYFLFIPLVFAFLNLFACLDDKSTGPSPSAFEINVIAVDPSDSNRVYVGTQGGGVYRSLDGGSSWETQNDLLLDLNVTAIVIDVFYPNWIYLATEDNGFFRSRTTRDDNDPTIRSREVWVSPFEPVQISGIRSIVIDRNRCTVEPCQDIFVASQESGVWKSTDGGSIFEEMNEGMTNSNITAMAIFPTLKDSAPTYLFVATEEGDLFTRKINDPEWKEAIPGLKPLTQEEVISLIVNPQDSGDKEMFATMSAEENAIEGIGIYQCQLFGTTCQNSYPEIFFKFKVHFIFPLLEPIESVPDQLVLYAGADGIVKSIDKGVSWSRLPLETLEPGVTAFAVADSYRTDIVHNTFYAGLFDQTFFKTEDGGLSWTQLDLNTLPSKN